jgi:hypothetical protein
LSADTPARFEESTSADDQSVSLRDFTEVRWRDVLEPIDVRAVAYNRR